MVLLWLLTGFWDGNRTDTCVSQAALSRALERVTESRLDHIKNTAHSPQNAPRYLRYSPRPPPNSTSDG
jgi:hypothetical protein